MVTGQHLGLYWFPVITWMFYGALSHVVVIIFVAGNLEHHDGDFGLGGCSPRPFHPVAGELLMAQYCFCSTTNLSLSMHLLRRPNWRLSMFPRFFICSPGKRELGGWWRLSCRLFLVLFAEDDPKLPIDAG